MKDGIEVTAAPSKVSVEILDGVSYKDDGREYGYVDLTPDEAELLADELRACAEEARREVR